MTRVHLAALIALLLASSGVSAESRRIVVISDLHMGLGRAGPDWHPNEDFRWPRALEGFLSAIDQEPGAIDLVIAGDFLELWEASMTRCSRPPGVDVTPPTGPDYRCTVQEMAATARAVVAGHPAEFEALARFAARDKNCLHVVPGNHDAALVIVEVWSSVEGALGTGCVELVSNGLWTSPDRAVQIEHGHQIALDPNSYGSWPSITKRFGETEFLEQPWGEYFVARLFYKEEAEYPLIDNLSPHSAGLRYRMADRGVWGSIDDVARFLAFNLFETSLRQKLDVLRPTDERPPAWRAEDVARARTKGDRLFIDALDPKDVFATNLRTSQEPEWVQLRASLAKLAADRQQLSDDRVRGLCDQAELRRVASGCRDPALGMIAGAAIGWISDRHVVGAHVRERWLANRNLRTWIYGHTHAFEKEWQSAPREGFAVSVMNDGAFQRLIDDATLRTRAGDGDPVDLLRAGSFDGAPACYTVAEVLPEGTPSRPGAKLRAWWMREEDAQGRWLDPCDAACARVGHGC